MLHVLNTRPAERAAPLSQALQQAGYAVTEFPLLELVAVPFASIQSTLAEIRQAAVVVVVSPAAAQLGLEGLRQLNILPGQLACQWVAVGRGTASVLAQAGIAARIPVLETSEGMLALDVFTSLQAQPASEKLVMFWRGHAGRQFMLKQLASQQRVMSVNLYERQLPGASRQRYQQLLNQPPQVLLISSGVSWQNWLQLGQQFGMIRPAYILVLGQRLAQKVRQQLHGMPVDLRASANGHVANSSKVIQLENLNPASVLAALAPLAKCQ